MKIPYDPGEGTEKSSPLKIWRRLEKKSATGKKCNDYYPFGLTFNSFTRSYSTPQNYKFQEQETQEETGWIQFKWRNADPTIGRFFNIDPLAAKYVYNSPYTFSENRVINGRELEGAEYVHYAVFFSEKGRFVTKQIVKNYTKQMTGADIQRTHGMSEGQFYQKYSKSFGKKGRGIAYTYYKKSGKRWKRVSDQFLDWDGVDNHGIYYGSGCPTCLGPEFDHKRGVNDYDYSLDPIDEVDALARQHDIEYDFDGYGDESNWPDFANDLNTIEADIRFIKGLDQYLQRAQIPGYIDRYTGRAPSEEAIDAAKKARDFFIGVVLRKMVLKAIEEYREGVENGK